MEISKFVLGTFWKLCENAPNQGGQAKQMIPKRMIFFPVSFDVSGDLYDLASLWVVADGVAKPLFIRRPLPDGKEEAPSKFRKTKYTLVGE